MSSKRCPECNLTNWETAISCKRCGFQFQSDAGGANTTGYHSVHNTSDGQQHVAGNNYANEAGQSAHETQDYFPQANWSETHRYNRSTGNTQYREGNQSRGNYSANYQKSSLKIKMAVVSLILGIFAFPFLNMFVGVLLSVVLAMIFGTAGAVIGLLLTVAILPSGLITGIIALRKANNSPREYGGKGMAIAGIALSSMGLLTIPIIAAIAVPNLLAARQAANEGSAISSIRKIAAAQNSYMSSTGAGNCADLQQLAKSGAVDPVLANGTKSGYRFVQTATMKGCEIYVTPIKATGVSATGKRSFFASSEESWQIRAGVKNGLTADINDPPIDAGQSTSRPKIALQK